MDFVMGGTNGNRLDDPYLISVLGTMRYVVVVIVNPGNISTLTFCKQALCGKSAANEMAWPWRPG